MEGVGSGFISKGKIIHKKRKMNFWEKCKPFSLYQRRQEVREQQKVKAKTKAQAKHKEPQMPCYGGRGLEMLCVGRRPEREAETDMSGKGMKWETLETRILFRRFLVQLETMDA